MTDRQCTFSEISGVEQIRGLSENQRRIISLINCNLCQADIADKLKFSRSYVNQVVKKLESIGLIKSHNIYPDTPGKRSYTKFYELSPQLKSQIQKGAPEELYTPMRTHFIRRKFKIVEQSGPVTTDKRTSWSKSWQMRGWQAHKFWFSGKSGLPSVSIDINPKNIVCYMDRGQKIIARSKEEAEDMGILAIFQARDKFIQEQAKFGITIETDHAGERIGKPHVGLLFREKGPLDSETHIPGTWVDASPEKELGPGFKEVEMHIDHKLATPLERAVMNVAGIEKKVDHVFGVQLPEAMKEFEKSFAPLTSEIHTVMAHIQSGQSVQNQINQLVVLVAQLVKDNHDLKERLEQNQTL